MREIAIGRRPVPVQLARRDVDHVARTDVEALFLRGKHTTSINAVQHLRRGMLVQVRARARRESHHGDRNAVVPAYERLNRHITDKVLSVAGSGEVS